MQLYEFEGKWLFQNMGIPTPRGHIAGNLEEARSAAHKLGYPIVVKCQIFGGGRGKAGGVKFAENEDEFIYCVEEMFGMKFGKEKVEKLLIEEKLSVGRELYMGVTLDPGASVPLLILSAQGGMDIEYIARDFPHKLFEKPLDPLQPQRMYHMIEMVSKAGLTGEEMLQVSKILLKLVDCYFTYEAITAEINPLIIDLGGKAFAADSKVEIDDSALFRMREVSNFERNAESLDPLEAEAKAAGVSYVGMDKGNIGLIAGGAGLGMASMDMISAHGGAPANFLDLGGDATPSKTATALRIVLKTPGVEGVLINAFGGINNCEAMARGIIQVIEELNPPQTIVVKMRGHSQEEGWALLEARNIPIVKFGTTEEAVILLLEEMRKKGVTSSGRFG